MTGLRWARYSGDLPGNMNSPSAPPNLTIHRTDIRSVEAQALIATLNVELSAQYPEEGACHFRLESDEVGDGRGAFLVAWRQGDPVGCGAVRRIEDGTGEIKRMFVEPSHRGLGIGRAILAALEAEARALGLSRLVLETGIRQREAISLYEGAGFIRIPPFGEYVDSPVSVCMTKLLSAG